MVLGDCLGLAGLVAKCQLITPPLGFLALLELLIESDVLLLGH